MERKRQLWALIFFGLLAVAPFIPVATSFFELRSAILFDEQVFWADGQEFKYSVPQLNKGFYELRLDSSVSDWQPIVKLTWSLMEKKTSREIISVSEPQEIILTKPIAKILISENTQGENELLIRFSNSNPTQHVLRIKLGQDRDSMLAKGSREFGIVLAVSLALMLLLWKPLMKPLKLAPPITK